MGPHLTTKPKVLVVGCGSIGRRHIGNLRSLGIGDIAACDTDAERLSAAVDVLGVTACRTLEDGFVLRPELVLVCTPPHNHLDVTCKALEVGAHVFVEKPLAATLDGVDAALLEAARRARWVWVGYNLRFHAGLRKVKELLDDGVVGKPLVIQAEFGQYLPDWRPGSDYREGYTANATMGGGIILDASHELDYVRWLGGEVESVYCAAGHLSSLEMDAEDVATVTLRLAGGVLGELHLDCVQRGYMRRCKVIGEEGTLVWAFDEGLRFRSAESEAWEELAIRPDPNEMYVEEMRHVLDCLSGRSQPIVDGATGRRVLEIALAAKESARLRREVSVT